MWVHLQSRWANHWTYERFSTNLYRALETDRKDMLGQIKVGALYVIKCLQLFTGNNPRSFQNFFLAQKNVHVLYAALWHSTKLFADIFQEPAPIYKYCTQEVSYTIKFPSQCLVLILQMHLGSGQILGLLQRRLLGANGPAPSHLRGK